MKRIITRRDFAKLAQDLGTRRDWHEPDEQEITVEVQHGVFDNAGFWPRPDFEDLAPEITEMHMIISQRGEPVAAVNLATLCAWAAGLED